jgi:hypothetical protein
MKPNGKSRSRDEENKFLVGPDDDYDPNEGIDSPKNLDLESKPGSNCVTISKEDPENLVRILVNIYGCEKHNAKTHAYGLQDKLTTVKEAIEGLLKVVTFSETGLQESTPTQELDSSDRAFDRSEYDGIAPSLETGDGVLEEETPYTIKNETEQEGPDVPSVKQRIFDYILADIDNPEVHKWIRTMLRQGRDEAVAAYLMKSIRQTELDIILRFSNVKTLADLAGAYSDYSQPETVYEPILRIVRNCHRLVGREEFEKHKLEIIESIDREGINFDVSPILERIISYAEKSLEGMQDRLNVTDTWKASLKTPTGRAYILDQSAFTYFEEFPELKEEL